jgi:hypothetical protein
LSQTRGLAFCCVAQAALPVVQALRLGFARCFSVVFLEGNGRSGNRLSSSFGDDKSLQKLEKWQTWKEPAKL